LRSLYVACKMSHMSAPEIFLKPYNPKEQEAEVLALWEKSDYTNPDTCVKRGVTKPDAEAYSIVLPPPNVTGVLHMGSALMVVIEDILIRTARMQGKRTLWLPGLDSAAIATQAKVETDIYKKEKKTRHDLGREELLKRITQFTDESKATIINQLKRMGASLDWSRYAYTIDEARSAAVAEAFVRMYEAGLIYRGDRIVNWDPKGQTTISDDEIVYEERRAKLYTFKYAKDFPIAISTTRPETKVGDTAVAVHPNDERYAQFVGKEYDIVFCDVPIHIKIVADESVEKDFGTGALGVTPAHSITDWEIADRHNLPRPQVINEYAKMTVEGRLKDLKTKDAREAVAAWLKEEKLLEKEEDVPQNISTAERTGGIVEPLPKRQWFVNVNVKFKNQKSKLGNVKPGQEVTLKELMRTAVESGAIKIIPERFEKNYYHWIDNLRDWCISRQIWFGHRIPAWHHEQKCIPKQGRESDVGKCIPLVVRVEKPICQFCDAEYEQDPDVLDTWFSSGLWTFSTLGWPQETSDIKTYHPTSVLETGYDIIFFWVARMILMSGFLVGQVPFRKVLLHGIVRDGQGRKISKSLGNNIDPLDMGEKYGMDAVRMSLIAGMAPGTDSKISEEKVRGYKHFANKIWNITRFVLENANGRGDNAEITRKEDRALIAEAETIAKQVSQHIDTFRLDLAADAIYHFVWHRFADEIIEESKSILKGGGEVADSRRSTLYSLLSTCLKLLHPFMPFVTEAIWKELPHKDAELLMIARWPRYTE